DHPFDIGAGAAIAVAVRRQRRAQAGPLARGAVTARTVLAIELPGILGRDRGGNHAQHDREQGAWREASGRDWLGHRSPRGQGRPVWPSTPPEDREPAPRWMEGTCAFAIDSVQGASGRRQEPSSGVSEHTVIGKIHASPERAPDGPGQAFSAGEALVQPSLNRISIRGRVAQVEPKVMQVLMLMAARPGTVIARSTFLDTVWAGTVADDYLLNRAISELRRILDDDPQAPRYIETIRKGGYRLVAPIAPARVAAALAPAAAGD